MLDIKHVTCIDNQFVDIQECHLVNCRYSMVTMRLSYIYHIAQLLAKKKYITAVMSGMIINRSF